MFILGLFCEDLLLGVRSAIRIIFFFSYSTILFVVLHMLLLKWEIVMQ